MFGMIRKTTREHAVTQRDIAERCGVHQTAVSQALRHDPSISAATRERILAVALELGYDPEQHDAARRLVSRRHGTRIINRLIALFLPPRFHQSTYFLKLFQGIWDVVSAEG